MCLLSREDHTAYTLLSSLTLRKILRRERSFRNPRSYNFRRRRQAVEALYPTLITAVENVTPSSQPGAPSL